MRYNYRADVVRQLADTALLNTQIYKVRIKDKAIQGMV